MFSSTKLLYCVVEAFLLLFTLGDEIERRIQWEYRDKACSNFNLGAAMSKKAGIKDVYMCPSDNIAGKICLQPFWTLERENITQSMLTLDDVVFFILIVSPCPWASTTHQLTSFSNQFQGPNHNADPLIWWLKMLKEPSTIVFVADPCPSAIEGVDWPQEFCDDDSTYTYNLVKKQYPKIAFHLVRVRAADVGYEILSCKLRTGAP